MLFRHGRILSHYEAAELECLLSTKDSFINSIAGHLQMLSAGCLCVCMCFLPPFSSPALQKAKQNGQIVLPRKCSRTAGDVSEDQDGRK